MFFICPAPKSMRCCATHVFAQGVEYFCGIQPQAPSTRLQVVAQTLAPGPPKSLGGQKQAQVCLALGLPPFVEGWGGRVSPARLLRDSLGRCRPKVCPAPSSSMCEIPVPGLVLQDQYNGPQAKTRASCERWPTAPSDHPAGFPSSGSEPFCGLGRLGRGDPGAGRAHRGDRPGRSLSQTRRVQVRVEVHSLRTSRHRAVPSDSA